MKTAAVLPRVRRQSPPADAWPTAASRISARVRGAALDRQLADGVATWSSRAHAARAVHITSARSRRGLARALERLLAEAAAPTRAQLGSAVVPACRASVIEAAPQIAGLAVRLRSRAPVQAAGVARLLTLLSDGGGPVYSRTGDRALCDALDAAARSLDVEE